MYNKNIKYLFFFYCACFLIIISSSCIHPPKIRYLRGDVYEVFKLAKRKHKKVFVLITQGECGSCSHFADFLDHQKQTREILDSNYICYKGDVTLPQEHSIAEIVKCPSYPFPYFFDENGNLLAFGFPNSKTYNIVDLSKISISDYRFPELFKMPISTRQYKSLVSLALKAAILVNNSNKLDSLKKALEFTNKSLDIAAYPFNYNASNKLAKRLNVASYNGKSLIRYSPNASDDFLYGKYKVEDLAGLNMDGKGPSSTGNDSLDYIFDKTAELLGTIEHDRKVSFQFQIKNLSHRSLMIGRVFHPCDCVQLKCSKSLVAYNQTAIIKGVFNPTKVGKFSKEIFVHTNSNKTPMSILTISGEVY
jgi:hypothetical protein